MDVPEPTVHMVFDVTSLQLFRYIGVEFILERERGVVEVIV